MEPLVIGGLWSEIAEDGTESWAYLVNRDMTEEEAAGVRAVLQCLDRMQRTGEARPQMVKDTMH